MAVWLNKLNIDDEMVKIDTGMIMDGVGAIRDAFAKLIYANEDDRHLHEDTLFDIDEAIDCFDGDDYDELVNTVLEYLYDFGDTLSGLYTGEGSFSQRKKLLWVEPWK